MCQAFAIVTFFDDMSLYIQEVCLCFWCVLLFDFAMWLRTFRLHFPLSSVFLWFYLFCVQPLKHDLYKWHAVLHIGACVSSICNRDWYRFNHVTHIFVMIYKQKLLKRIKCLRTIFSRVLLIYVFYLVGLLSLWHIPHFHSQFYGRKYLIHCQSFKFLKWFCVHYSY